MVRDFREATIADIFEALNLPERGKVFRDIPEDLVPGAQAHVNTLNQYVEEVEDFFDEKARRFKDILWNVWAVEDTYAQKLRGIREKLEREKLLTDLLAARLFGFNADEAMRLLNGFSHALSHKSLGGPSPLSLFTDISDLPSYLTGISDSPTTGGYAANPNPTITRVADYN